MRDPSFSRPPLPAFLPADKPRVVSILGSTGSIGIQALELIAAHPDTFQVGALAAGSNMQRLAEQAVATQAPLIGLAEGTADAVAELIQDMARAAKITYQPHIICGDDAATLLAQAEHCNVVLNGITGSIGLEPTLAALKGGKLLALANKESLITGGALVKAAAAPGQLIPVDSEHSALAQALWAGTAGEVKNLILTASGGPFRGWNARKLGKVTPEQALNHPVWDMGKVITTNSATLVNKALEVVEAHLLFDVPLDQCTVVVHPEHYIHSMVEFHDGAVVAQISQPDMKLPIALGIGWPARIKDAVAPMDWSAAMDWHFEPVDEETFPAINLAIASAKTSATHMAVYNAANEEAVHAFHAGLIKFPEIVGTVAKVVAQHHGTSPEELTLDLVLEAERWARQYAQRLIETKKN